MVADCVIPTIKQERGFVLLRGSLFMLRQEIAQKLKGPTEEIYLQILQYYNIVIYT